MRHTFAALLTALAIMLFNFAWAIVVVWVVSSAITSVVKAGTESCGITYSIESVGVSGDWFCSTTE